MAAATTVCWPLGTWASALLIQVNAASLPGRADDPRDGGLAGPSCASEITSFTPLQAAALVRLLQEVRPEGLGLRRADARPTISRRPSVLTATAIIAATETIRPPSRTLR